MQQRDPRMAPPPNAANMRPTPPHPHMRAPSSQQYQPQQAAQSLAQGVNNMRISPAQHAQMRPSAPQNGVPRPGMHQSAKMQPPPGSYPQQHYGGMPPQAMRPGMAPPQPGAPQMGQTGAPPMRHSPQMPGMMRPGAPQGAPQGGPPPQGASMRPPPPASGPPMMRPALPQQGSMPMRPGAQPMRPGSQPMHPGSMQPGVPPTGGPPPQQGAPLPGYQSHPGYPQPQQGAAPPGHAQRSAYPQHVQAAAPPNYASRPGYPQPPQGGNKVSVRPMPPGMGAPRPSPMRPMPPGANGAPPGAAQPPVPGAAPPHLAPQQQQQPAQPAQLPSSAMPRPPAMEPKCGTPRAFFHRGLISNLKQGSGAATIPTSNSDFIAVDDGSTSLRYMRLTTSAIASEPAVMSKSGIPLAVVMSPFADPVPGEGHVPIVDFSATGSAGGPLRCDKCHAYANPGFKFVSGGSQFQCNMCRATCDTPTAHYSPISPANGLRMDADTRYELRYGSVEYTVGSKDYQVRPPQPASYVYAVDVSTSAIQSGVASSAIMSIRSALSAGLLPGAQQGARVAVFTFDAALHFYDARGADDGRSVSVHVVPDVNDPFVPLGGNGFLQTIDEAVSAVDAIIEMHGLDNASAMRRQQQQDLPSAGCALGSALQAILIALGDSGGKAFVVSAGLPTVGMGRLERRGGGAVGGGEGRERSLLKPANSDYEILGCELAEKQISVDLFLAPASVYTDAATLVRVPRACGGRLFTFDAFDRVRDSASLHRAICTATSSVRAFEALLRVRTSVGLEAAGEYLGHFGRPQRGDDVSGPVFDSITSTALEINVVSKLMDGSGNGADRAYAGAAALFDDACVQCAVLFTDPAGQRRIRVHTVFASKTTVLSDVFRLADMDATVAFVAKKAASAVFTNGTPVSKAKDALVEKTVQALFVYRKRCTSSSISGQLILPEALKMLPVTILGLQKSDAFRSLQNASSANEAVSVDNRVATLSFIVSAMPADIAAMGYPRMWELQELPEPAGKRLPLPDASVVGGPGSGGRNPEAEPIALPNAVALNSATLSSEKVFLVENGMRMVVWLGDKVSKEAANDVIAQVGAQRLVIRAETAGSAQLLKEVSADKGRRIAAIVNRVLRARPFMSRPEVVVRAAAGSGGEARHMMPLLVEDRAANGAHSYVEFLRFVHSKVLTRVANESAQNEMQTWEMLNHGY